MWASLNANFLMIASSSFLPVMCLPKKSYLLPSIHIHFLQLHLTTNPICRQFMFFLIKFPPIRIKSILHASLAPAFICFSAPFGIILMVLMEGLERAGSLINLRAHETLHQVPSTKSSSIFFFKGLHTRTNLSSSQEKQWSAKS